MHAHWQATHRRVEPTARRERLPAPPARWGPDQGAPAASPGPPPRRSFPRGPRSRSRRTSQGDENRRRPARFFRRGRTSSKTTSPCCRQTPRSRPRPGTFVADSDRRASAERRRRQPPPASSDGPGTIGTECPEAGAGRWPESARPLAVRPGDRAQLFGAARKSRRLPKGAQFGDHPVQGPPGQGRPGNGDRQIVRIASPSAASASPSRRLPAP